MPADPRRVKDLFAAALDLPDPPARQAFLDRECGADADLRRRLEVLLAAHDRPDAALDRALAGGTIDEPADAVGTVVAGRYKLLEEIGEGGMGAVWMAEQREPVKRLVALKLIKPGMDSRAVLARFEAERQALALMDHPNIAKVFDGGTTDQGRPYFVMELVKGLPLTEYCDARRLNVRDRLDLFVQVCQAVQHAHQKGVIHRDLKPSNVLVTEHDGRPVPKVIDFGLAKALHATNVLTEKTLHTAFGAVVGTPLYMAPEQVGINALDVDTRTDIYALGVILYELLTGTTPLEKRRLKEAMWDEVRRLIREEEPPRPSLRLSSSGALPSLAACRRIEPAKLSRLVRGELDWIVMKALEKDRNRRYETATGFAADVGRHLSGEPVHAVPPSAAYRLRKFCRRHAAAIAITVAIFVSLKAVTLFSIWQVSRAQIAETIAAAERDEAERQRDRATDAGRLAQQRLGQVTAERQRADENAAVTRAVSDFLVKDLLAQGREADVKLRTVLDRAADQVGARFAGQPAVEASVRATLGTTYFYLGLNREALPHLERAYELYRTVPPPDDDPTLGQLTIMLVGVYGARGNQEAAMKLQSEWEQRIRRLAPPSLQLTPKMRHNDLIQALKRQDASPFRDSMLKLLESMATTPDPQMVDLMRKSAAVRVAMAGGHYPEAEKLLVEVIDAFRARAGDPAALPLQFSLGMVYRMQHKYAEAEATIRQALELMGRTTDPNSPRTVLPLMELAYILIAQKNFAAAEPYLRQALTIQERETLNTVARFELLSLLGECLVGLQKYAEAEALLLSAHEGLKMKGLAPKAVNLGAPAKQLLPDTTRRLVDLYTAWGKTDEAAKWRAERAKYAPEPAARPPTGVK